jgi:O-methyltransferase
MQNILTNSDVSMIVKEALKHIRNDELVGIYGLLYNKHNAVISKLNHILTQNYHKLDIPRAGLLDQRYTCLIMLANEIMKNNVEGAIAEFGVYRGNFAKRIRALIPNRKFYLFDTFSGFDENQLKHDKEKFNEKIQMGFDNTSVDIALKTIGDTDMCIVKQGFFPETAKDVKDDFAFVSLDVDLYQPIFDGLNFFYDRLSPGGYILVHDYQHVHYLGCGEAVRDFCEKTGVTCIPLPDNNCSAVITKNQSVNTLTGSQKNGSSG